MPASTCYLGNDMSQELLTIKEIAGRLNQPESNIRYYRDKFEKYLPSVGEGRKKRFKPEAMEIFETIVNGQSKNLSAQDIEKELAGNFAQNPSFWREKNPPEHTFPGLYSGPDTAFIQNVLSSQAGALEKMAEALKLERGFKYELL